MCVKDMYEGGGGSGLFFKIVEFKKTFFKLFNSFNVYKLLQQKLREITQMIVEISNGY